MSKFNFKLVFIATTVFLLGCKKTTFDKAHNIAALGRPTKIAFYKHIEGQASMHKTEPEFSLTEIVEIEDAMKEINGADNPEPWKGAGWDNIIITYADTAIKINTNRRKIGFSASGSFYDLNKNNFIIKRLND